MTWTAAVVQIWSRNKMFDAANLSTSDAVMAPWRIISRSNVPSGEAHSLNAHVIVGARLIATQFTRAVVSPA